MDWKIAATAFATLFMAEMGDKTQLAVITMSAGSKSALSVFVGAAAALVLVTALGAIFGRAAAGLIPEAVLRRVAASAFIAIGAWMWIKP